MHYVDSIPTIIKQIRGNLAKGYIVNTDLTITPCYVARSGDCFAHGATAQKAMEDAKTKEFSNMDIDSKIEEFIRLFGKGKHSGHEFFRWHGILTGSCEFGRMGFVKEKDIGLDKKYNITEFIELVKFSYGKEIIEKIQGRQK